MSWTALLLLLFLSLLSLLLQGSVWGSGSAGTLCAVAALAMGDATFWQVIYSLMCYAVGRLTTYQLLRPCMW